MQPPPPPTGSPRGAGTGGYPRLARTITDAQPPRLSSFEGRPSSVRTAGPNLMLIVGGGCAAVLLLGAITAVVFFLTMGAGRLGTTPAVLPSTAPAPGSANPPPALKSP